MKTILRPGLLGIVGLACLLWANVIAGREGDVATVPIFRLL